jgi:hypothetical protein
VPVSLGYLIGLKHVSARILWSEADTILIMTLPLSKITSSAHRSLFTASLTTERLAYEKGKMSGSRTKTGCYTCRIRKKKCDEEKPFCLTCRSRDIHCDGYGTKPDWMNGMNSWKEVMESKNAKVIRESAETTYKSRRRNRSTKKRKDSLISSPHESADTLSADCSSNSISGKTPEALSLVERSNGDEQNLHSTMLNLPHQDAYGHGKNALIPLESVNIDQIWWDSSLTSIFPSLRSSLGLLVTFLDVIFPLQYGFCCLSGNLDLRWLIRVLSETKPLYQASLSLAISFKTAKGMTDPTGVIDARRLQMEAIRGLQKNVADLSNNTGAGKQLLRQGTQTLGIMLQLLSLEIFTLFEGQWEMHLRAAHAILGMFQKQWTPELFRKDTKLSEECENQVVLTNESSENDVFALNYFVTSFIWVDIIANATYGPPAYNPKNFTYTHFLEDGRIQLDEMMGCQISIMLLIVEITALESWRNAQIDHGSLSVMQLAQRATRLNDELISGINEVEANPCPRKDSIKADSDMVSLGFAYGALVYLHTIVSGPSPYAPEIQHNTTRCLEVLEAMPSRLLIRNCLTYTFAGCMATEDQYERFRGLISRAALKGQEIGSAWKGAKIMEECWRLRNLGPGMWCWRSTLKSMNLKILLI